MQTCCSGWLTPEMKDGETNVVDLAGADTRFFFHRIVGLPVLRMRTENN